jgi:replicative superfamily II helicase
VLRYCKLAVWQDDYEVHYGWRYVTSDDMHQIEGRADRVQLKTLMKTFLGTNAPAVYQSVRSFLPT